MSKNNIILTEKREFIELFEEMIDWLIAYEQDGYTDDILCDMQEDPDVRQEAFNTLMEWLSDSYETGEEK
jgi:hypothetical protein